MLQRGTESGKEVVLDYAIVGRPIDLELVNNQVVLTTVNGGIFPASFVKGNNGGDPLDNLGNIIDMEPVGPNGEGYLVLDRFGNVHAYGTAAFFGSAAYEEEVILGTYRFKQKLPLAVDLEVVTDPANPAVNLGYYILAANGKVTSIGNVPELPSFSEELGIGAVAMNLTAKGYTVLLRDGFVVEWNGTEFNTVTNAIIKTVNEPTAVDFVQADNEYFVMNELGEIFTNGKIKVSNKPESFQNLIGFYGFYDIELQP
ncbi:MAG: hypothetical protein ACE15F_11040 [bacterium]